MSGPPDNAIELLKKGAQAVKTISNHSDKSDGEFSREMIREAIEEAANLLKDISHLARNTDDPKAYRVAGSMVDTIVAAAKSLTEIPKTGEGETPLKPTGEKTTFLGSPSALMKMLDERKKESDEVGRELDASL